MCAVIMHEVTMHSPLKFDQTRVVCAGYKQGILDIKLLHNDVVGYVMNDSGSSSYTALQHYSHILQFLQYI